MKFSIDTKNLSEIANKYERMGKNVNNAIDNALIESKKHVTESLIKDTVKPNFPAQGNYSTGRLKDSINTNYSVDWVGSVASINVGYDFDKSGLTSILMLRGAPRKTKPMPKAKKIYADIYGKKTRDEINNIQLKAFLII